MPEDTTTLVFRIERDLKTAFEHLAKQSDRTVSQMLRQYIRWEVEKYAREHAQKELFKPVERSKPETKPKVLPKPKKPQEGGKKALLDMFKGRK